MTKVMADKSLSTIFFRHPVFCFTAVLRTLRTMTSLPMQCTMGQDISDWAMPCDFRPLCNG